MKHDIYGVPAVDSVLALAPRARLRGSTGDDLGDEMTGILIGFATILRQRGDHIDFITCRYAAAEMLEMVEREKRLAVEKVFKSFDVPQDPRR